jgi:GT2 family glycosyltransferase
MSGPAGSGIGKVSVAVLSWNGRHHLEHCLPALAAQEDPGVPWEVLLLDNGSTDGTAAWVAERFPRVKLLESPVNLGFAAGNNRLVEAATGDAVALLNNDTRPDRGWLKELVAALAGAEGDVAAVSGLIVDWEARRLDFARGVMTFDGHAFQLGFRRPLGEVELPPAGSELAFPCGGNVLVRRESFLAAGGFDADYFAYLEDVDLGWRLWSGGERVLFAPAARVRHRSAATSDLLGLYNRGFLFERNAFLTAYKNYQDGLWERVMPAVLLTLLARTQALAGNGPGGGALALDPYAGHIAGTAAREPAPETEGPGGESAAAEPGAGATDPGSEEDEQEPGPAARPPGSAPVRSGLADKWRAYGPREFLRRGLVKGVDRLLGSRASSLPAVALGDERTVAQFRALAYLLGHLDEAAAKRRRVQARRCRPDGEYFERFPAYLVPTYPGDEALFAGAGFGSWLPEELPLVRRHLDEVMELGE